MKHLFFTIALILTFEAQASEKVVCQSSQTSYTYVFDITNNTVDITSANDSFSANAEVTYTPGQGEDILYTISQGEYQVGVINGEEGLRANFDHGIFESNLLDTGLNCESVSDDNQVMWNEEGDSCAVDAYVFESSVGEQDYVSLTINSEVSNGHYLMDTNVYQTLFVEKKEALFETDWNSIKYVGKKTDKGYEIKITSSHLLNRIYKNFLESSYTFTFNQDGSIKSIAIKTHEKWPFPSNIVFNNKESLTCQF
jgi:hypothetical protein